jgi:hypothetical protein
MIHRTWRWIVRFDKRGVTFRNPGDGDEQEWGLAKQYRDWSEAPRFKSPRTSAALENVAKMFEGFARRQDEDTEGQAGGESCFRSCSSTIIPDYLCLEAFLARLARFNSLRHARSRD